MFLLNITESRVMRSVAIIPFTLITSSKQTELPKTLEFSSDS